VLFQRPHEKTDTNGRKRSGGGVSEAEKPLNDIKKKARSSSRDGERRLFFQPHGRQREGGATRAEREKIPKGLAAASVGKNHGR